MPVNGAVTEAFDCVAVSISTLEFGRDIGDLDRVIQVNCPPTVARILTGARHLRDAVRSSLARGSSSSATRSASAVFCAASIAMSWLRGLLSFAAYTPIFGSSAWARFISADVTS